MREKRRHTGRSARTKGMVCSRCGHHMAAAEDGASMVCAKVRPEFKDFFGAGAAGVTPIFFDGLGIMISALVPAEGSEARSKGIDLIFPTCSEACSLALSEVLRQEKRLALN